MLTKPTQFKKQDFLSNSHPNPFFLQYYFTVFLVLDPVTQIPSILSNQTFTNTALSTPRFNISLPPYLLVITIFRLFLGLVRILDLKVEGRGWNLRWKMIKNLIQCLRIVTGELWLLFRKVMKTLL